MELVCEVCGEEVIGDHSYSNRGKNVICHHCLVRLSNLLKMDRMFFIRVFTHRDLVMESSFIEDKTKELSLEGNHVLMWLWLSLHPYRNKTDYLNTNNVDHRNVGVEKCFACEYTRRVTDNSSHHCDVCPINLSCSGYDSLYNVYKRLQYGLNGDDEKDTLERISSTCRKIAYRWEIREVPKRLVAPDTIEGTKEKWISLNHGCTEEDFYTKAVFKGLKVNDILFNKRTGSFIKVLRNKEKKLRLHELDTCEVFNFEEVEDLWLYSIVREGRDNGFTLEEFLDEAKEHLMEFNDELNHRLMWQYLADHTSFDKRAYLFKFFPDNYAEFIINKCNACFACLHAEKRSLGVVSCDKCPVSWENKDYVTKELQCLAEDSCYTKIEFRCEDGNSEQAMYREQMSQLPWMAFDNE